MKAQEIRKVFRENSRVENLKLNDIKRFHIISLLDFIAKMEDDDDTPWEITSVRINKEKGIFSVEILTPEVRMYEWKFTQYQEILKFLDPRSYAKAFDEETVLMKFIISDIFAKGSDKPLFTVDDLTEEDLFDLNDF